MPRPHAPALPNGVLWTLAEVRRELHVPVFPPRRRRFPKRLARVVSELLARTGEVVVTEPEGLVSEGVA
jgi:hypothetical protein